MKKVLLVSALLLILVAGVVLAQNYLKTGNLFLKKNPTVTINNHKFEVTVADSKEEQEIGLSKTAYLPQDQGMIFVFEKPDFYSFWMKNMKLPIDIIYIDKDQIVTIHSNVQPAKSGETPAIYTSTEPSDKVLEIQAGLAEKYDFKKGDIVKYDNLVDRN